MSPSLFARCLASACLLAGTVTLAQTPVPLPAPTAPASSASGVPRATPDPAARLSPAELSQRAVAPDERRPAGAVVPQLSLPIGRPAPTATAPLPPKVGRPAVPAATGAIDDAAARCEAREDDAARAACRAELRRQRGGR